jgi:hypothetical protein
MKLIRTPYRHSFNADGTFRRPACRGFMEIVTEASRTFVCCSRCGEGYRFKFVMREKHNGADA